MRSLFRERFIDFWLLLRQWLDVTFSSSTFFPSMRTMCANVKNRMARSRIRGCGVCFGSVFFFADEEILHLVIYATILNMNRFIEGHQFWSCFFFNLDASIFHFSIIGFFSYFICRHYHSLEMEKCGNVRLGKLMPYIRVVLRLPFKIFQLTFDDRSTWIISFFAIFIRWLCYEIIYIFLNGTHLPIALKL